MEQSDRKIIDGIREGLLLVQQNRLILTGNPYAALNQEICHKTLNIEAELIFNHLRELKRI